MLDQICYLSFERTVKKPMNSKSQPRSIAIADFNRDNKLDIVIANSGKDNIMILFQNINGLFVNETVYSTNSGSNPYSIAVTNLNHDQFTDIVVANYGTNNIGLFFGRENGIFHEQITLSTGNSRPLFVTVNDLNNDNQQDIIVVYYGTNSIGIFFGHGNGTFRNEVFYTTGYDSIPYSLVIADFNHDKYLDIGVTNYGTNEIMILFGYVNGTFINSTRYSTNMNSHPCSISTGDFNNDNFTDIVVANSGTNSIGIFFGYGDGTFKQQWIYTIGTDSFPSYVTTADINQDNQTDIIIIDSENSFIHILPGYGNGTFSNLTTFVNDKQTQSFSSAIADLNNDNQLDLVISNYGTDDILILSGYSKSSSVIQTQYSLGHNSRPTSLLAVDLNNDRFLDIVATKSAANSISILFGYGNGNFAHEITYSTGMNSSPRSISTGDFNNDNRIDLVVANYRSHTIGIYLAFDHGKFSSMISYSTGFQSFPISVAVADFNNDTFLDIVVANVRIDNVAIFLGYGNGSFNDPVSYSTGIGSDPCAIVVADFNKDKRLDIAVANNQNSNVGIFFGDGHGHFQTIVTYSTGFQSHPDSMIAADLNNDNWLDFVIADSTSDYIAILFGNENGTFGGKTMYTDDSFSNPTALTLGDVNYDNKVDIILTNFGTANVAILIGYGNGTFQFDQSYPLPSGAGPRGVTIADFNNNTRWDICIVESGTDSISLLVRYVQASFLNKTVYSIGNSKHPHSVAINDFNNDNQSDITVANSGDDTIGVLIGYGNGSFKSQTSYFIGTHAYPQYVTTADLNQDNSIDIISTDTYDDSISILFGYGNGTFYNTTRFATGTGSKPYWIAVSDFNDDNNLDLVIANQGRDSIGILLASNYIIFQNQGNYSNQFSLRPSSIISYDLNNDTHVDIAATFATNDSIGILFGYGNGTFQQLIVHSVGLNSYPYEVISVDINNDHILDIITANTGSNTIGVLIGYGDGRFASVRTYSTGYNSEPYGAASGDFNNDSNMDIVVANYRNDSIGILFGFGNGSFATVIIYLLDDNSRPQSVAVGDFNQDRIDDIVVANYRQDNICIFINNGDGTFQKQMKYSTGYTSMPTFVIVSDLNNDDLLDVAVSNKNSDSVGIFYGYGNGTFHSIVLHSIGDGASPYCIRSGDFNNDHAIDIAVVSPGINYHVVLYGLGDGRFLLGPYFSTGTKTGPISMAVGDFNHDNKLDITTANFLMNNIGIHISYGNQSFGGVITYSTGFGSDPQSVAVSDFNQDNQSDVVVANYGTSNIGIFLGFGDGSFTTMSTYSMQDNCRPVAVTTADLNQDNQTDIIVVNSESNNIYIFFGYGNGSFYIKTIYSTGFGSRPHGIATGDFNNDDILDIVVVTAGTNKVLLVQGFGNGTFGNETSYALGYNFDPYAVAIGDFNDDDWLDIAVANYGGDYVEILLKICEYYT